MTPEDIERSLYDSQIVTNPTPAQRIKALEAEVEELQDEVAWQETPMRARHKRLLSASEAVLQPARGEGDAEEATLELEEAIADCKRNGPK